MQSFRDFTKNEARLAVGDIIAKQYRVERLLGGGGMSVVYQCTDLILNRVAAVKLMRPESLHSDRSHLRFQQEARAVGRLHHPSIVAMHHCDFSGAVPLMVMDYINGPSLAEVLSAEGAMSVDRCLRIVVRIVDALEHAHANHVVHRDLKPSNIMMEANDHPVIVDFGIAKLVAGNLEAKTTQTGEVFGSPAYMSPEQISGKPVTAQCDQYALGCVIFECLTGCPPFLGPNAVEVMFRHLTEQPQSLTDSSLGGNFSQELEELVARLLAKEPQNRFADIGEVKRALESVQSASEEDAIPATSEPPDSPAVKLGGRTGLTIIASALAMITTVSLIFFYVKPTVAHKNPAAASKDELNRMVSFAAIHAESDRDGAAAANSTAEEPDTDSPLPILFDEATTTRAVGAWVLEHKQDRSLNIWTDAKLDQFTALFTDGALKVLSGQHNLRTLNVNRCVKLTGTGFSAFVATPLTKLQFDYGGCTNAGLRAISSTLKQLEFLTIAGSDVSDEGISYLKELPLLAALNLRDCKSITNNCFGDIAQMRRVWNIDLTGSQYVHEHLQPLCSSTSLRSLQLRQTGLDDDDLAILGSNEALLDLNISGNSFTDVGLAHLAKLPRLRNLDISGCKNVHRRAVANLSLQLPHCRIYCQNATAGRRPDFGPQSL
ncbi:MAG TPA: protein kinase [Planktothrix sp.]